MENEVVLRWIQSLGFPIVAAVSLGYALWKIGNRIIDSHFSFVDLVKKQGDDSLAELKKQSKILENLPSDFSDVCKAQVCFASELHRHDAGEKK